MLHSRQIQSKHDTAHLLSRTVLALALVLLLGLTAAAQSYHVQNLVSDIPNVGNTNDTNLSNAWGLAAGPGGPWWVNNNNTWVSTLYDAAGNILSLPGNAGKAVHIPDASGQPFGPGTGMVFNPTPDFQLSPGKKAFFIFATEDGTISGWNPGVDPNHAILKWVTPNAVYKGLAMASVGTSPYLYATNFHAGVVDVFDANFNPHSFGVDAFKDYEVPSDYAPFNIANVGGELVVTWALPNAQHHDDVSGAGHGYVSIFNSQGVLLGRLRHSFLLDSPWGVALAPPDFGRFSGSLLIGNFGSGSILAFDKKRGVLEGVLVDESGLPIRINSLWAIAFGNDGKAGPHNSLYFTSGYFEEAHGLFGSITAVKPTPGGELAGSTP